MNPDHKDSSAHRPARRIFLKSATLGGAAAAAGTVSLVAPAQALAADGAPAARPAPQAYVFLLPDEAAFVEAAIDVFIPKDAVGPGGVEAGVAVFIDRQLAGAWGAGAGTHWMGPFAAGTPTQGYQLPFTPQQVYRLAIREVNAWCRKTYAGKRFDELPPPERDRVLKLLQQDQPVLATVPARVFLLALYNNTMEGYFADPAYGGNRDKAVWKMLGFPGVGYVYSDDIVNFRGKRQVLPPQSLADFG